MSKYPRNPKMFTYRTNRMKSDAGRVMLGIPPLAASECEMVLWSYYGSKWKMVRALFWKTLCNCFSGAWLHFLFWFSDVMGWTKLHHIPETKDFREHVQRHGGKCSGSPNCAQECIDRDQPKWFRKVFLSKYER